MSEILKNFICNSNKEKNNSIDLEKLNFKYAIGYHKWGLKQVGLWPVRQDCKQTFKLCMFSFIFIFINCTINAYFSGKNNKLFIENLLNIFILSTYILKMFILKRKRKILKKIFEFMIDFYNQVKFMPYKVQSCVLKDAKKGRCIANFLSTTIFGSVIGKHAIFIIKSLLNQSNVFSSSLFSSYCL